MLCTSRSAVRGTLPEPRDWIAARPPTPCVRKRAERRQLRSRMGAFVEKVVATEIFATFFEVPHLTQGCRTSLLAPQWASPIHSRLSHSRRAPACSSLLAVQPMRSQRQIITSCMQDNTRHSSPRRTSACVVVGLARPNPLSLGIPLSAAGCVAPRHWATKSSRDDPRDGALPTIKFGRRGRRQLPLALRRRDGERKVLGRARVGARDVARLHAR